MTVQIPETFIYQDDRYRLIGIDRWSLFQPREYGFTPECFNMACYNGYYCTYELTGNDLFLRELVINDKYGNYPLIGGVHPEREGRRASYKGLEVKVNFSGKIQLAKSPAEGVYDYAVHQISMGFETVLDMSIDNGKIMKIMDRSQKMADERDAHFREHRRPGTISENIIPIPAFLIRQAK